MHPEIIGVGLAVQDHLMLVPEFPNREGMFASSQYAVQGGGMVATALVAAQKLGATTELWGRLGDDDNGHAVLKELKSFGVGTSQVHLVPQGKTGVCFVMVKEGTGERSFVVHGQKNLFVDPEKLHWERLKKSKALLVDASWAEVSNQAARAARVHRVPVIVDVHDPGQTSLDLLGLADFAIIPRQLADVLTSDGDYPKALHELKRRHVKVPIITLGAEGCLYLYKNKIYHQPAFEVEVVDTTGAGDCFHGGFCFGLTRGFSVQEAIHFATAVAAMSCTRLGGRSGVPSYDEAVDFMRAQVAQA